MKPEKISVTRKFNLGNYQTVDYHIEATLDEGEDIIKALKECEQAINDYWEGRTQALIRMAKKE